MNTQRFHIVDIREGEYFDGFDQIEDASKVIRSIMEEYDANPEDLTIVETYGTLVVKDSIQRIKHSK